MLTTMLVLIFLFYASAVIVKRVGISDKQRRRD